MELKDPKEADFNAPPNVPVDASLRDSARDAMELHLNKCKDMTSGILITCSVDGQVTITSSYVGGHVYNILGAIEAFKYSSLKAFNEQIQKGNS